MSRLHCVSRSRSKSNSSSPSRASSSRRPSSVSSASSAWSGRPASSAASSPAITSPRLRRLSLRNVEVDPLAMVGAAADGSAWKEHSSSSTKSKSNVCVSAPEIRQGSPARNSPKIVCQPPSFLHGRSCGVGARASESKIPLIRTPDDEYKGAKPRNMQKKLLGKDNSGTVQLRVDNESDNKPVYHFKSVSSGLLAQQLNVATVKKKQKKRGKKNALNSKSELLHKVGAMNRVLNAMKN